MSASSDMSKRGSTSQPSDDMHDVRHNAEDSTPVHAAVFSPKVSGSPSTAVGIQRDNEGMRTPTPNHTSFATEASTTPPQSPPPSRPEKKEENPPSYTPTAMENSLFATPTGFQCGTLTLDMQPESQIRCKEATLSGQRPISRHQSLPPPFWPYRQSTSASASDSLAFEAVVKTVDSPMLMMTDAAYSGPKYTGPNIGSHNTPSTSPHTGSYSQHESMFMVTDAAYSGPKYPGPISGSDTPSTSSLIGAHSQSEIRTPHFGSTWKMRATSNNSGNHVRMRNTEHGQLDMSLEEYESAVAEAKRVLAERKTANLEQESKNIQLRARAAEAKLRRMTKLTKELEDLRVEIERAETHGNNLKNEEGQLERELRKYLL